MLLLPLLVFVIVYRSYVNNSRFTPQNPGLILIGKNRCRHCSLAIQNSGIRSTFRDLLERKCFLVALLKLQPCKENYVKESKEKLLYSMVPGDQASHQSLKISSGVRYNHRIGVCISRSKTIPSNQMKLFSCRWQIGYVKSFVNN